MAWISPAFRVRLMPLRIALPSTVAWRFSILSIWIPIVRVALGGHGPPKHLIEHVEPLAHEGAAPLEILEAACALKRTLGIRHRSGSLGDAGLDRPFHDHGAVRGASLHPTLPPRLIPSGSCASTANSIGSSWKTSRAPSSTVVCRLLVRSTSFLDRPSCTA